MFIPTGVKNGDIWSKVLSSPLNVRSDFLQYSQLTEDTDTDEPLASLRR
jgi:hypothetical protein